ncbi:MAG: chloride channel protein [Candidatus Thorarchaeota archaeon]
MMDKEVRNQRLRLYTLASAIGVISGLTAVTFRWLIMVSSAVFALIPAILGPWAWCILPALGGIFVSIIVFRFAPETKGHGVPEIIDAYALRGGKIRMRVPLLKSLASALCIGSGGSCGREGPIAQIGGGVGSSLASSLKLNKRMTKTLVICGTASGIAATFNAPLGGALFGIEVIAGGIAGFSVIPIILSSVVATAVADAILGSQPSFQAPFFSLTNYPELGLYLLLGLLFGLLSVAWTRGFYRIEDVIEKIKIPNYVLPVIGGLIVGVIGFMVISLEDSVGYVGLFRPGEPYQPAIMGVGYAFIDATLVGNVTLVILFLFGFLKAVSTSITLGSGGSGGVFAPTLFIGAALGGGFGILLANVIPGLASQPMAYALVGMAALFAGSGRAPITCIVMVMEMTGDYSMILPLMIAVSTSYLVASSIEEDSIYTLKLSRRGVKIRRSLYIGALKEIEVEQIMTTNPTSLSPEMSITEVLKVVDDTHHTKFPVVDENMVVHGTLVTEDLFSGPEGGCQDCLVRDFMDTDFLTVIPSSSMDSVLHEMLERDEGHAVVVDAENCEKMIGFITKADVLRAYRLAIFRLREEGEDVQEIDPLDMVGL